MNTSMLIKEIDSALSAMQSEAAKLRKARAALAGVARHHRLSPDARARISAAQRKRWAKVRRRA
jgi:hypothetical protein